MYKHNIAIHSINAARSFVAVTQKYPQIKMLLCCNEYEIDPHSIIGILSLDLSKPLTLTAEGDNLNSFISDLEPYTV